MIVFFVFLLFSIWSTSFTLGKVALDYSPPLFLTGARMFIAGILILGFLAIFRRKDLKIKTYQLFPLFLLSLTGVYLTNIAEFWGLQYLTSSKACFIYSLSPFFSAIFSYFQFKEKITFKKILGLCIGFIGFIPAMLNSSENEEPVAIGSFFSWAEIALIFATATSAYGWILLRKLRKDEGMSSLMANGSSMLLGGIFALLHSAFVDSWKPLPISNYQGFLQGIGLMILISNLICSNFYGWLLKRFTTTFLTFAGLMTPLFTALFGWIFLGETVSWPFFVSLGIVSFGLWLVYSEELRLGYIIKKTKLVNGTSNVIAERNVSLIS